MTSIKHRSAELLSIISVSVLTMAGCVVDPAAEAGDAAGAADEADGASTAGCSTAMFSTLSVSGNAARLPSPAVTFPYATSDKAFALSMANTYVDASSRCVAKINALRQSIGLKRNFVQKYSSAVSKETCGTMYESTYAYPALVHANVNGYGGTQGMTYLWAVNSSVTNTKGNDGNYWGAHNFNEAMDNAIDKLFNEKDASGRPAGHAPILHESNGYQVACAVRYNNVPSNPSKNAFGAVIDYYSKTQ